MKSCPMESVFVPKAVGGLRFIHQSGKPGQVLTGAALPRTTDVCRDTGLRIGMVNLTCDTGSTSVARHLFMMALTTTGYDILGEIE